ncbi:hypothetical protein SEA_FLUDD_55 [Mycobacterium phage Fludd]|uniref:Helix-turn-helix DNA binding protein n=10 Tax=Bixzunavirus Bxz1 TaxID=2006134 RepID=B5LK45_9CAUD|nr:HTH DNA binding protein [Mycobacterium phage Spud]YP_002224752.1 HTH DNA binding protein [Mycobacterium phage Rizal]AER25424.1 hypothetical protein WALLY_54 [Mycobacterium phage Wally]AFL46751.1 hypothetical protein AVA3_57 [Mycobacterium phage Ava3]AGV99776.1 hypothetical protein PBI_SHRIMP_56 [Mycobacterium phage Shrimp]AID18136.1 hypothetical protein PBI_WILLIS_56 [Mycobacterium phage Willis]AIX12737.1 hypothetical protein PBI_ZYGOTAIGA_56 [Mycobacterium phage ZygoTaiga]AKY02352.1 hypo
MARSKVVSIQATPRRSYKSSTAKIQAETLRKASRAGLPWEDDEVARLAQGIAADETSREIALSLGRTYYGVMGARTHVRFALDHWDALVPVAKDARKKAR